eukprot:scaffold25668_cov81-Isochrysis_galbana.AAC.2
MGRKSVGKGLGLGLGLGLAGTGGRVPKQKSARGLRWAYSELGNRRRRSLAAKIVFTIGLKVG